MTSCYDASFDRYIQKTDDSKSHKLKNAFWTTKQVVITKLRRKQDENIVASDSDLDAKLELLKSVQTTCRDLDSILGRYQRTICYLSQAENEMGRFLKQYSLEDKTQAGKIMSAVGKALSSSAQQRLALLNPLDRVHQEVKTFRQRAITDTLNTVKRMEHGRTEYRGALLWMKNVSSELDPDTYKQLEKFRCVQAQVRKAKASFDRLKVDSMQKVDLLAASRCNMLSHVLVGYQNTLLVFLEKTSHMMVAVAESFRGYQYYEFSVLRHLRPESRKLAGYKGDDVNEWRDDETKSTTDTKDNTNSSNNNNNNSTTDKHETREINLIANEEELDKRLDEIFRENNPNSSNQNITDINSTGHTYSEEMLKNINLRTDDNQDGNTDFLSESNENVPAEHRDLFSDLFSMDTKNDKFVGQSSGVDIPSFDSTNKSGLFAAEWDAVFGEFDRQPSQNDDFGPMQSVESKETFKTPMLPSHLLDKQFQDLFNPMNTNNKSVIQPIKSTMDTFSQNIVDNNNKPGNLPKEAENPLATGSHATKVPSKQPPTNLDAWMNLFADLGAIGNPDSISKKDGQITDA
uniref:AH domain-containing protein n=1 Tax=Trichobilharzia regenti TaxID=157069 RepID=A0AA85J7Z7_TRIRE|nr:unnamed protein product [Trichobilharzia regenti]